MHEQKKGSNSHSLMVTTEFVLLAIVTMLQLYFGNFFKTFFRKSEENNLSAPALKEPSCMNIFQRY